MTRLKLWLVVGGIILAGVVRWLMAAGAKREAGRLRDQLGAALGRAAKAGADADKARAQAEHEKEVADAQAHHDAGTAGNVADWVDDQFGR